MPSEAPYQPPTPEEEAGFEIPEPREIDRGSYKASAPGDHPIGRPVPAARPMAWVYGPGTRRVNLAWIDEHGRRRVAFATPMYQIDQFAMSPDGEELLVVAEPIASRHQVLRVQLASGAVTVVCERGTSDDRSPLIAAAYTVDDTWLVASEKQLRLFDAKTGVQVASLKAAVDSLRRFRVYRGGSLVVLAAKQTAIVAIANHDLKRLGTVPVAIGYPAETEGGRLIASLAGRVYEITHIEPLFSAFASKQKRAKTSKPKSSQAESDASAGPRRRSKQSSKKSKPELVEIPDQRFPAPPDSGALRASLGVEDGSVWDRSDGAALGLRQYAGFAQGTFDQVHVRVAADAPVLVRKRTCKAADLSHDRARVLVAVHEGLDLARVGSGEIGEFARVFSLPSKEYGYGVMGLADGRAVLLSSKALYLLKLTDEGKAELLHVAKVSSGRALHPIHELGIYVVVTAYPNKLHVGQVSGAKTRWLFKENVDTNDVRVVGHDVLLGPALTKKGSRRLTNLGPATE